MWTKCDTMKERVAKVRSLLESNDRAVYRGIVAIYKRQTEEEQCNDTTRMQNGVGFSAFDAPFMSSLAKQLLSGNTLTAKQLAIGRNKILRYSRQLAEIAELREASK